MKAQPFKIKSSSKALLTAMWNELLKLGYIEIGSFCNPKDNIKNLEYISTNEINMDYDTTLEEFKVLYAGNIVPGDFEMTFTLPEQWNEALQFAEEQLNDKYWIEENPLIAEAKRRYPSGTKFLPAHVQNNKNNYCIVVEEEFFTEDGDIFCKNNCNSSKHWASKEHTEYGNTIYNRCIYYAKENKWAEIFQSTPKEWDVDTYFIVLQEGFAGTITSVGDVYKIKPGCRFDAKTAKGYSFAGFENSGSIKWFATLEEAEKFSEELLAPKFEVGKWYKLSHFNNTYLKYLKTERSDSNKYNLIYYSDLIWQGDYKTNSYIAHTEAEEFATLLTDLLEIQQYLPDGHPDKQFVFEKGEYYTSFKKNGQLWRIFIFGGLSMDNQNAYTQNYINTSAGVYCRNNITTLGKDSNITHKVSTPEERQWLDACIKADKYLTKEEALTSKFIKGKWYKTVGYNCYAKCESFTNDTMRASELYLVTYNNYKNTPYKFCPGYEWIEATKEEIQFFLPDGHPDKIVTKPKVGDWVVVTKAINGNAAEIGSIGKLVKIDTNPCNPIPYLIENDNYPNKTSWAIDVRLATSEEIAKVNKPKPSEEFILPEKWYIKDCKVVSKWASEIFNCADKISTNFLCVDMENFPKRVSYNFESEPGESYTKITPAQFEKYVLNIKVKQSQVLPFGNLEFTIDLDNRVLKCKEGRIPFGDIKSVYTHIVSYDGPQILGYDCVMDRTKLIITFGCCHGTFPQLEAIYKEITK